jgi:hypothetical protein
MHRKGAVLKAESCRHREEERQSNPVIISLFRIASFLAMTGQGFRDSSLISGDDSVRRSRPTVNKVLSLRDLLLQVIIFSFLYIPITLSCTCSFFEKQIVFRCKHSVNAVFFTTVIVLTFAFKNTFTESIHNQFDSFFE